MAGPIPGGRSKAATRHGRAPRLTFCSGPIFTGNFSASTTPTRHAGISDQRHAWTAAKPPTIAATAASTAPAAGTASTTAFSGLGKVVKAGVFGFS